jgi:hypothetical protein
MGIDDLIDEAWHIYREADGPYIIKPAIPILYFGDSERYFQSARRVVTVGLNPSRAEFPDGVGLRRFPAALSLTGPPRDAERRVAYRRALDTYFCTAPYRDWFNAYEPLLNGLGCSYYGSAPSTALHTDLCAPLATDPTWSKLPANVKARLEPDGGRLWSALIEHLAPDLIIASVAREHIRKIDALSPDYWDTIHTIERGNPYEVRVLEKQLGNGKGCYVVFGPAAQKPFGTVSTKDKLGIGQVLGRTLWAA